MAYLSMQIKTMLRHYFHIYTSDVTILNSIAGNAVTHELSRNHLP